MQTNRARAQSLQEYKFIRCYQLRHAWEPTGEVENHPRVEGIIGVRHVCSRCKAYKPIWFDKTSGERAKVRCGAIVYPRDYHMLKKEFCSKRDMNLAYIQYAKSLSKARRAG